MLRNVVRRIQAAWTPWIDRAPASRQVAPARCSDASVEREIAAATRELAENAGCSVVTVARRLFKARNRFERLARRDPALAPCVDKAAAVSRSWQRFTEAQTRRAHAKAASTV